jgi:hypothetical protein
MSSMQLARSSVDLEDLAHTEFSKEKTMAIYVLGIIVDS